MRFAGRTIGIVLAAMLVFSAAAFADKGTPSGEGMNWADNPDVTFYWIDPGGTVLSGTPPISDQIYEAVFPGGFTFNFYGQNFDRVYVSTNGFITFNNITEAYPVNDNLAANQTPDSLLAIFWDDIRLPAGLPPSRVFAQTLGFAPFRKFVITFDNLELMDNGGGDGPVRCQIMLYESSNIIKYQYLDLTTDPVINNLERGGSASIGLRYPGDNLIYSVNTPVLNDETAILFFPDDNLSANFAFSGASDTVNVGTVNQRFTLNVTGLQLNSATTLQNMGKADVVRIRNPFPADVDTMKVSGVWVDGQSYFLGNNQPQPPSESQTSVLGNIANWHFDAAKDSLYIQLPSFAITDSIRIEFNFNVPSNFSPPATRNFNSNVYARLNGSSQGAAGSPQVEFVAGPVAYYEISPSGNLNVSAGQIINFTVTAFNQFGHTVTNSDQVLISAIGSTTANYNPNAAFSNSSSFIFPVFDNVTGVFSMKVTKVSNPTISVTSGSITVGPATPSVLEALSGNGATVTAGNQLTLRARVRDSFSNNISGQNVLFTVTGGGGNFSGSNSIIVTSDNSGVAEVTYTTGTTAGLANTIQASLVSFPGVTTAYTVNTTPGAISYFTVIPNPGVYTYSAGTVINFNAIGYDVNDNPVTESGTAVQFSSDGTSVTFPGGTSGVLSNGAVSFNATTTLAQTFRTIVQKSTNAAIRGFSDPLTITAAAPATLVKAGGDNQQSTPNQQLPLPIQVQLLDAFSNPVIGSLITFDPVGGGSVSNPTSATNTQGIATTDWTVHSSATQDRLLGYLAGTATTPDTLTFLANVVPGNGDTLIRIDPPVTSGEVDTDLGDKFEVQILDNANNPVPGLLVSFAIVNKPAGASNESLTAYTELTDNNGIASTRLHLGTKVGDYTVRAFNISTVPVAVDFVATATAGAADSILIVSGNNQSGPVGQTLGSPIVFRLTDRFLNPVSGTTMSFAPSPGNGSVSPTSAVTDDNGQAQTSWTLGPTSGVQTLQATTASPALSSNTVTATGLPGGVARLNLVYLRSSATPFDSIAAVGGESIPVVVEALDAQDNPVSGAEIDFTAEAGYDLLFQSAQLTTGSDGRVTNLVTTDAGRDSSFFQVASGVNQLPLHIYHIAYSGTLSPASVVPGQTGVAFNAGVINYSPRSVTLDAAATRFRFNDGSNFFNAALNSGATLLPGPNTLVFNAADINATFNTGSYTPQIFLRGSGSNAQLSGSVVLPTGSLSVLAVEITNISGAPTILRGETLRINMTVRNDGPNIINIGAGTSLVLNGATALTAVPVAGNPTQIGANTSAVLAYDVVILSSAGGLYTVDGFFNGTISGIGTPVSAQLVGAYSFTVLSNALLTMQNFAPGTVTTGTAGSFTAELFNTGESEVVLAPANSYFSFGTNDTLRLKQSYAVPTGGAANAVEVLFVTTNIQSPAAAAPYSLNLRLNGLESGSVPFDTTIANAATLLVQDPPNVVISSLNVLPDTVAQNQQNILAEVVFTNSGANNADAVITLPAGATGYTRQAVLDSIPPQGGNQTIVLSANASSAPLTFAFSLGEAYPAGEDGFRVRYRYRDANNNNLFSASPVNEDTFQVLTRARLALQDPQSIVPDTVFVGVTTTATLTFSVVNQGQSPARIDASGINIEFNNDYSPVLQPPASLPDTLAGGASRSYVYQLTLPGNVVIGPDPLDLAVSHSDVTSGVAYTDINANNLDTLWVLQGAGTQDLQIQTVSVSPGTVNQGNSGIAATVTLKNLGDGGVLVDTVRLTSTMPGLTGNFLLTPQPPTFIAGNSSANFVFSNLGVPTGMPPGTIYLDAEYMARGAASQVVLSDSGAVSRGTLNILKPSALTFSPLVITPDSAGEGQGNIIATTTITNGDSLTSSAKIQALNALLNPNDGSVTAVLEVPSPLPTLLGGQSVNVRYRLSVANPAPSSQVAMQVRAGWRDLTDNAVNADTSAADTLTIIQDSDLQVNAIAVPPDTVTVGQSAVPVTITVRNNGQAPALLSSVSLQLVNGPELSKSLQTFTLPDTLLAGQETSVNYNVNVPANLVLGGTARTVFTSASLQGIDILTGSTVSASGDSLDSFVIVDSLQVVNGNPPVVDPSGPFSTGSTVAFRVNLGNDGGAPLHINSNTILRLVRTNSTGSLTPVGINLALSDTLLNPGDTDNLLQFGDIILSEPGSFRVFVELEGTVYGRAYRQVYDTEQFISVGEQVAINAINIVPSTTAPGETALLKVAVGNSGAPVSIDPSAVLDFRYNDGTNEILPVENLTRIDTLTMLPSGVDTLRWTFDIPFDARTAAAKVDVTLSFESGLIMAGPQTGNFRISTGVQLEYVAGSLTPDPVIPGQNVQFRARFINRGSNTLVITPGSSYISFSDTQPLLYQAFVSGNFSLNGAAGAVPDTSEIIFKTVTLNTGFEIGQFNADFRFVGTQPNGDVTDTTLADAALVTTIAPANVILEAVDVLPLNVVPGQSGVTVNYTLRNTGSATASVNSMSNRFSDAGGGDISSLWTQSGQSPELPQLLPSGQSVQISRNFIVSPNISAGPVAARAVINYNDAAANRSYDQPAPNDTVNVIVPARLFVSSLELVNVPNALQQRVNYNQPYQMDLALQNSGQDPVSSLVLYLINDTSGDTLTATPSDTIAPGAVFHYLFDDVAGAISETRAYRAVIGQALSLTSGTQVQIGQPIDDDEDVIVQQPRALGLAASTSGGGSYSQGQEFTVSFSVIDTVGESGYGSGAAQIQLPANLVLISGSAELPFSATSPGGSWLVRAQDLSTNPPDTISVVFSQLPLDLNTGLPVGVTADSIGRVTVSVDSAALILSSLAILSPAGAQDSIVSTGQSFVISDTIRFAGGFVDNSRSASIGLPPGFAVDGPLVYDLTAAGNVAVVSWTVIAPAAVPLTQPSLITFTHRGVETNTGSEIVQQATLPITVVTRSRLSLAASLLAPTGAVDGILSTYQYFDLRIAVNNLGTAGTMPDSLNEVQVELPAGFSSSANLTRPIATGGVDTVRIRAPQAAQGPDVLTVRLVSAAPDINSNTPALVTDSLRQIANLNTVRRASLDVDVVASGTYSTGQQNVPVNVSVRNTGQAAVVPDSVGVELTIDNAFFSFNGGPAGSKDTLYLPFVNNLASGVFNLDVLSNVGSSDISAAILPGTPGAALLQDANNNYPDTLVFIADTVATQTLMVDSAAQILATEVILSPAGAQDSVVSTGQMVVISDTIRFFGGFNSGGRSAQITLPTGFSMEGPSEYVLPGDTGVAVVTWTVIVPATVPQTQPSVITFTHRGTETNTGSEIVHQATLPLTVVTRSRLNMTASILTPAGAVDGILSTYQYFDLRIAVNNLGTAGTMPDSLNEVQVELPPGFTSPDTLIRSIATGGVDTVRVRAPQAAQGPNVLSVRFLSSAPDINSNTPALVVDSLRQIANLNTVRRASLDVDVAASGTYSTGQQNVPVNVSVRNTGQAAVVPDSVGVELTIDNAFFSFSGGPAGSKDTLYLPFVNNLASGAFHLDVLSSVGSSDISAAILPGTPGAALLQDANNNYPDTLVFIADTVATQTLMVDSAARIFSNQEILTPAGAQDSVVSTGQTVVISDTIRFFGGFNSIGRNAQIALPAGFSLDGPAEYILPGDTGTVVVSWTVIVPASVPQTLPALITFSHSGIETNTGDEIVEQTTLPLQVVTRARLSLAASILAPSGAFDGTLSTYQYFDLRIAVNNLGAAGTMPDSLNEVQVELPPGFTSPDTMIRAIATGGVDTVRIRAPQTARGPDVLTVRFLSSAPDINSNTPALVVDSLRQIANLNTVRRASLDVDVASAAFFSTGQQNVPVNVSVRNTGQAAVVPDTIGVELTIVDTLFAFTNGQPGPKDTLYLPLVNNLASGVFHLDALANTGSSDISAAILPGTPGAALLQDANNNYPDTLVFIADSIATQTVTIDSAARIISELTILSPAGARDSVVSTGQSFVISDTIIFAGGFNSNGRSAQITLPAGFSLEGPAQFILPGDTATAVVSWTVNVPASVPQTLPANISVIHRGVETNTGDEIVNQTTLPVTVVTRTRLSLAASILAPSGATDATLSTFQFFDVRLAVNNLGVAGTMPDSLNEVQVELPAGFSSPDNLTRLIATGGVDTVRIRAPQAAQGPDVLRLRLVSAAPDSNSNTPAQVADSLREIANLNTVSRASLSIGLDAGSLFAAGQTNVPVNVQVQNSGQAQVVPGSVGIELTINDTLFNFTNGQPGARDTLYLPLVNNLASGVFRLDVLDSIATSSIRAAIIPATAAGLPLQDANNNYPDTLVFIADTSIAQAVEIQDGGGIVIDSFQVRVRDQVAEDDTLSNGQDFTLRAFIAFSSNIAPDGRFARISLPLGFTTSTDSVEQAVQDNIAVVDWRISINPSILEDLLNPVGGEPSAGKPASGGRISAAASKLSRGETSERQDLGGVLESLVTQEFQLDVEARGVSAIDTTRNITASESQTLWVEERAEMAVNALIADPPGARLGVLSTTLPFDLNVWVDKLGDAGLIAGDSNYVSLRVPSGFRIDAPGVLPGDSILPKLALGTGPAAAREVRVYAPDNAPAGGTPPRLRVRLDSTARDINTLAPAFIGEALETIGVTVEKRATLRIDNLQAGSSTLGSNQPFVLSGVIANVGKADVEPGDSVSVELSFDPTRFQLQAGQSARKRVKLVNKQAPVSWNMQTGPELGDFDLMATIIDSLSYDEHGFDSIAVYTEKSSDTATVTIADVGNATIVSALLYNQNGGNDTLTVSTEQTVQVALKAAFTGAFTNRTATLLLPSIFPTTALTDSIPAATDSVTWSIQIPDTVTAQLDSMKVLIQATSQINPAITRRDSAMLYFTIQERATLLVNSQISAGAVGNTVSQGQSFTVEAVVSNLGGAGVLANPSGELTLELGNGLELGDGEVAVKAFQVNQPVSWNVDASQNAVVAGIVRQIQDVTAQKAAFAKRGVAVRIGEEPLPGKQTPQGPLGSTTARKNERQELDETLNGLYAQLNSLVENTYLRSYVSRRPLDANSLRPARLAVPCGCDSIAVTIAEAPFLEATAISAPTVLSTEQLAEVRVTVEAPINVVERKAVIFEIPAGIEADSVQAFNQDTTVSWTIQAVSPASGLIRIAVEGRDQNSTPENPLFVRDTIETAITVESKALLQLSTGSRQISVERNDTLTIQATVRNLGQAGVVGDGSLRIDLGAADTYILLDADTVKTFSLAGGGPATVSWRVQAPNFDFNSVFEVSFVDKPTDVNSGKIAAVENSSLFYDVNMVASELRVARLDEVVTERSYVQGQTGIAVIGLAFSNENTTDAILINNFGIEIVEGPENTPVSDPDNLLKRIEVVGYDYHFLGSGTPGVLGAVEIDAAGSGSFTIGFTAPDTVRSEETSRLILRIDLTDQNVNRNFSIRITRVEAVGLFAGNRAQVLDASDVPIGQSLGFQSLAITILSADAEEVFRNYPNPFGIDTQIPGAARGETRFSFFMENDGDVSLSIYTLLGRLVWSTEAQNLPSGLHDRTISWNGLNGMGDRVVNGVYIAVLKIRYNTGSTKTLQTKVAYIK